MSINISDDCISRQAAIRWVKTECNPYGKPTLEFESGKKVIEHLEQMPSVDITETETCQKCQETTERVLANAKAKAEPTQGEWHKEYADELCLIATYTCSECGSMELSEFKYCPNCGAKMKGGTE